MMLKSENSAKVLSQMTNAEKKDLSIAMSNLGALQTNIVESVLEDSINELKKKSPLVGNINKTSELLSEVLGEKEAETILSDINSTIWDKLSKVNVSTLANYLKDQHPQIIAVVLSKLDAEISSEVLINLDKELAKDVIKRISSMDEISKDILNSLEESLSDEWYELTNKPDKKKVLLDMFDNFDKEYSEMFVEVLASHDKDLAESIKKEVFTFDDVSKIGNEGAQALLTKLDKEKLIIALKDTDQSVSDIFFNNMSERAARVLRADMESMGKLKKSEIESAKMYVAKSAKAMIKSGDIIIDEQENGDD